MKILLAEPNASYATRMFENLETGGHTVDRARDGAAALRMSIMDSFDVLVLALRLPKLDAIAVCRRLRQELRDDIPVIVYEESPVLRDTLAAFHAGADDVVRADIPPVELEARMHAVVRRRTGAVSASILRVGDLTYDPATLEVRLAGYNCAVSPLTRRLLARLMRDSPRVVTNKELEQEIWGEDVPDGGSLRSHIWTLRQIIRHPAGVGLQTVRGAGYRLIASKAPERVRRN